VKVFLMTLEPVGSFHSWHDEMRIDLADGGREAEANAAGNGLGELPGASRNPGTKENNSFSPIFALGSISSTFLERK
jgi:hypothetical protein